VSEHEVAWSTTVSSAAVRSLGLLYVLGGIACVLGGAFPMDPHTPTVLLTGFGLLGLGIGAGLFLARNHARRWVLHLFVGVGMAIGALLVHEAATLAGAVVTAFDLPFAGIYAAYFLTRRSARCHIALGAVLFTIAWYTRAGETPFLAWGVVVTSLIVTSEVLGNLMSQLQRSAVADDLTGLLNRTGLRNSLDREIARSQRTGRPLSLVVLDVDGLKQVNDILGHASGDRLLSDLAAAWADMLRKGDLLARVGGDEFVLVMPETTPDTARDVVERLRVVRGPARGTRWSAGVASLRDGEGADDLMDRADRRMYAAKRAGRSVEAGV